MPGRLFGRIKGTLNVGIGTYSYHNLSLEDMVVQLTALRIKEIEISRGQFMLMNNPRRDLFCSAKAMLDRARIRWVSYYSATIKDGHDVENAVRFARLLGVWHVTGDATGDVLTQIDQGFTQTGLSFGIHNYYFQVEKFAYESSEDVPKVLSGLSKTVGVTADVGHFASCGHDPVDAIRKLAPRQQLVHLKERRGCQRRSQQVGKGVAKIPEVMQELHQQAFAGLVAVEYEKEGSVEDDMRREVAFASRKITLTAGIRDQGHAVPDVGRGAPEGSRWPTVPPLR